MPLFHYPKAVHKRTQSPGPFTVYRTYKKHLKIEFDNTCVYCRMPDTLSEVNSYAVEHYKPKNQFPELETDYSNLFYSCCDCNSHKGSYWPTKGQYKLGMFIPNPCDYVMHDHLRLQTGGTIKPNSLTGQWTIDTLDLNSPKRNSKRSSYLVIKKTMDATILTLQKTLTKLKKIEKGARDTELISVQGDITKLEDELSEVLETIKIFGN